MLLFLSILVVLAVLVIGFLGIVLISALVRGYVDVKSRPRAEMMWCNKHGHFRKEYCLTMPTNKAMICPSCYWEAIKGAHQA